MRYVSAVFAMLMAMALSAQAPDAFNYQAVARNAMGDPLVNTAVGIRFQLHQGTAAGTVVYAETHAATTNALGLFTLQVGQGSATQGSFAAIDWGSGPYFLEVGLDAAGGANYVVMGTQQLLSVPYALFAQRTPCFSTSLLGDTLFTGNGCFVIIPGVSAANGGCLDVDQDGYYDRPGCGPVDCIDTLATANPAAAELCGDGLDNDCDGQVDELTDPQAFTPWFADADGDGFGSNASSVLACAQPTGFVANNDDCNDADAQVFPGNGCSLLCNEADAAYIAENQVAYLEAVFNAAFTCFFNSDLSEACITNELAQLGTVSTACNSCGYQLFDCMFNNCVADCNGGINELCAECLATEGCLTQFAACVTFTDIDGDGWATESDCNDANAAIHPFAPEDPCNGIDDNCNGVVDEGLPTWYQDADGDGWGDPNVSQQACTPPPGFTANSGDCNDADPAFNPATNELCNGLDDNCNGVIDDGPVDGQLYYPDNDGDGYGDAFGGTVQECTQPAGFVVQAGDCDDFNPFINPGMIEYCDLGSQVDNNCDGLDQPCVTLECGFYAGQSWGTCGSGFQCVNNLCVPCPTAGTPCDDGNGCTTNDHEDGLCNCVGTPVANGTACSDPDPCTITETCVNGACQGVFIGQDDDADGFTDCGGDCNDQSATIFPGAPELCDAIDNDCDGLTDEDCPLGLPCDGPDPDQCANGVTVCGPAGECQCNEAGPGSTEVCGDLQDNDCDGIIDEGCGNLDLDQDGFADDVDCDDQDPNIFPGAIEQCFDTQDNDCDGLVDEGCPIDQDGDGFVSTMDCDDTDPTINPGAAEVCVDGVDNNCNGVVDEDLDLDGDSFTVCQGDCNDGDALVNPGAFEIVGNGIDDNCNGAVDEAPAACSTTQKLTAVTAVDLAQAMGLCQMTTVNGNSWGLISAQQLLANGSTPSSTQNNQFQNLQCAVLTDYGTGGIVPTAGSTFAGLSTGRMRDANDPGFAPPSSGTQHSGTATPLPSAYLLANGGSLPSSNTCVGICPGGSTAFDAVNLRLQVRVPTNATAFSYQFRFFTADYLSASCNAFNDHHLALLTSQAPGLPADKNIAFDALGNTVSVNGAFMEVCVPNGCRTCPLGNAELTGTGMDFGNVGGGTTWRTVTAPVVPGEVITLDLMIFDVADGIMDANVLLDNFQWIPAQP